MQIRPDGEMDITTVFGTVVPGSSPGRGTKLLEIESGDVVSCRLARVWFNGRTSGCQSDDGSSILPTRTANEWGRESPH